MPTKIDECVQSPDGTRGKTWNPITGCTPVSEGCRNCYAAQRAKRLAGRYGYPEAPHEFDVTLHPDRLEQPLYWKKPRHIFVCSMSDLFHEDVPLEYINRVFKIMAMAPQHTFQILTKRPYLMSKYFQRLRDTFYNGNRQYTDGNSNLNYLHSLETPPGSVRGLNLTWPLPNIWLGVSVENQATADERIPLLLQTPAAVKFVSCEPLLSALDLSGYLGVEYDTFYQKWVVTERGSISGKWWLDLVMAGGEFGPGARPMNPDWATGIRDQCQSANVPFFFKSWGAYAPWGIGCCDYMQSFNCDEMHRKHKDEVRQPYVMFRVGKKYAGRLLDGREWNEMPEVIQCGGG